MRRAVGACQPVTAGVLQVGDPREAGGASLEGPGRRLHLETVADSVRVEASSGCRRFPVPAFSRPPCKRTDLIYCLSQ